MPSSNANCCKYDLHARARWRMVEAILPFVLAGGVQVEERLQAEVQKATMLSSKLDVLTAVRRPPRTTSNTKHATYNITSVIMPVSPLRTHT